MRIRLFKDDTVTLRLDDLAVNLNRLAPTFEFVLGKTRFFINSEMVVSPDSYRALDYRISQESSADDEVILFTEKPYDNNYFWDSDGKTSIVSLFAWDKLTTLPRNNGAAYLICALVAGTLEIGQGHKQKNTGCINDFWEDKTGIDMGLRSGYICQECVQRFKAKSASDAIFTLNEPATRRDTDRALEGIQAILDDVSTASRAGKDVCDFWSQPSNQNGFDVFLCHNSDDKIAVRDMNKKLIAAGIRTWLDEDQLPPGRLWQDLLEEQIQSVRTAAVFVGATDVGPWQNVEIRAFLQEFVHRQCPVIPVILDACQNVPRLPLFLNQLTWVDFRKNTPDPFQRLLWGITGRREPA